MFTINNGAIIPNPETLTIYPYSVIHSRDTTSHKEESQQAWRYIEYFCSPKKTNPFYGYSRTSNRSEKIIENIKETFPQFELDDLIIKGVAQYDEFWNNASPKKSFYESALIAAKKLEGFYLTFDLEATNLRTGAPIYKPKEITTALIDTQGVLKNLDALAAQVNEEIYDAAKSKANRTVNHFER